MRFSIYFQLFAVFACLAMVGPAQAKILSGLGKYFWGPPHSDTVRPYLEEAKIPHNSQWADDEWSPQDWVEARGGNPVTVVNGFYRAGIVVDQYFDDDIPVLEVGQGFIDLSDLEKTRVVAFMDEVFGVTKFSDQGVILIYFTQDRGWLSPDLEIPLGLFNAQGLQLQ